MRRIARSDARIRGLRRISRRGLAGAVLEGMRAVWEVSRPSACRLFSTRQARRGGLLASRAQQWEHCGTMSRPRPSLGAYREICRPPVNRSARCRSFASERARFPCH
ncbi:MAG: hypothetical protein WB713_05485 [Methyloceanibacter sp.]